MGDHEDFQEINSAESYNHREASQSMDKYEELEGPSSDAYHDGEITTDFGGMDVSDLLDR